MSRCLVAIALIASSTTAYAQPAGAQAEVLFREGRDLMAAGKVAEACDAFEQSQKLEPAISTLLNLAGCREKNNQLATAWGLFLNAERETRAASNDSMRRFHDIAKDRATKLEPRISKLTINVPDGSRIDGLEISRAGEPIQSAMWNRAMPVDGGTYTVTARAPGANEWSTSVTIAPEKDDKTVDVPDLRNRAVVKQPVEVKPTETVERRVTRQPEEKPSKAAALAFGATSVALLGGAVAFNFWGDSTYEKAKAEMLDQSRRDSLFESANMKRYAAEGLAAAGVVSAGVAIWLYLREPRTNNSATAMRGVPTGSGLSLAGTF